MRRMFRGVEMTYQSKYKVYCIQDHWYLNEETDTWEENGSCECNFMRTTHEKPITEKELHNRFKLFWTDIYFEDKPNYVKDKDFVENTWGVEIESI